MKRILLSVPHMGGDELSLIEEAFATNWISTVGPHIQAFEQEFSAVIGAPTVAVASGTAALHLGLRAIGVGPGDDVFCSTLGFVAAPNSIAYVGARPVFIDSDTSTWNMDPDLLVYALRERAEANRLPRAVMVVHLYGQTADMDPILEACGRYDVPVIEDAAEAVGSTYKGRAAGTIAAIGAYSFNGNKIITTSGGGMVITQDAATAAKVRFWATQARDPGIAYEHSEMGYNYRISNLLAAVGRGQLRVLPDRIRRRREIAMRYRDAFAQLAGITLMPQAAYGLHTNWLSCFLIDPVAFGGTRDELIAALDAAGVEARPVWKPMHLQPLYSGCARYAGDVAEDLFRRGLCLPSSSNLGANEQEHVIQTVCDFHSSRVSAVYATGTA